MDQFYLIVNGTKDQDYQITNQIIAYLEKHGKICGCQPINIRPGSRGSYTDVSLIPEGVECFIVLGGDGTLIQAARDTAVRRIPFVGVNLGTLGYLTEAEQDTILPMLDALMNDEYVIEERMMLSGKVYRQDKLIAADIAMNDVVITRRGSLRVIRFKVFVNGEFLNFYTADGIIYATPTGSTAYNLSAGGPIVSPNSSMIVMTPICPHTLNSRSIVLSDGDQILVELCGMEGEQGEAAVFDGDTIVKLEGGDRIEITRAQLKVQMIKLSKLSFFETLRRKMADI